MAKVTRRERAAAWLYCASCAYGTNTGVATCPNCGSAMPAAGKPKRAPRKHAEDDEQRALFDWVELQKGAHPDLAKLYHVPNGGARNKAEAGRMKAMGVRAGVLDLSLDVARGGWFGLRLELKATRDQLGRKPPVSPEQRDRIAELLADGYLAVVAEGWVAASQELLAYVKQPRTPGRGMVQP